MAVRLRMQNSKQAGSSLPVVKTPFLIGRHANCDLRINSPRVSVHHCAILLHDGKASVKDLDSTNGTRVNGEPVHPQRELAHGDVIWVGPALIEVMIQPDELDMIGLDDSNYTATNPYLELPDYMRDELRGDGPKTTPNK